jgi:prophage maintenance system killer protein
MAEENKGEIVIYKAEQGPELRVKLENETVWLTLQQMTDLFQRDKSVISRHIKNVYKEAEVSQNSTVAFFATVQKEGNREVERQIEFYNLDVIISVGYRVNSKRGTQFRIWATQKLRDYLLKGYLVNEKRLKENQAVKIKELEQANKLFHQVLENQRIEGYEKDLLKIITDYTETWILLNQYDKDELVIENVSIKSAKFLEYEKIKTSIERFRVRLLATKEASGLFGQETGDKLAQILGSIKQSVGSKDAYPSVEEKAAHLLYFAIKDHPFVDGNKRIGSLMFLLFLIENNSLINKKGERKINDSALAALALLIAESKPSQKDVMIRLIVNLINRK